MQHQAVVVMARLASSLGVRDEGPNIKLAKELAATKDTGSINLLAQGLQDKNKSVRNDCIKVLYEVGYLQPNLVSPYLKEFIQLLSHKDNRLQWGGMTALQTITTVVPKEIFKALPVILKAAEQGSVITKDGAMMILIALAGMKPYHTSAMTLIFDQLQKSLPNQLPMYAERIYPLIDGHQAASFIKILQDRLCDVEKESKKQRIEKLILQSKKLFVQPKR